MFGRDCLAAQIIINRNQKRCVHSCCSVASTFQACRYFSLESWWWRRCLQRWGIRAQGWCWGSVVGVVSQTRSGSRPRGEPVPLRLWDLLYQLLGTFLFFSSAFLFQALLSNFVADAIKPTECRY